MRVRPTTVVMSAAVACVLAAVPAPPPPTAVDAAGVDVAAVAAAQDDCTDLEVAGGFDPLPYGVLVPCPGIRPGARMSSPAGCTFNFVFRGTSRDEEGLPVDEGLFIGTAGHCIFDKAVSDTTWAEGSGIVVKDGTGRRIGESVYGIDIDAWDFALIRIDDALEPEVNPAMCHFGGPVGLAGTLPARKLVHHFGQGMGFSSTVQGRTGAHDHYSAGSVVENFVGTAGPGDSGSGVIDADGRAIGALVRLAPGRAPGFIEVTTLDKHLPRATTHTGIEFELVTAPMAP